MPGRARRKGFAAIVAVAACGVALALPATSSAGGYGGLQLTYTATTTNFTSFPGRGTQATYHPCVAGWRLAGIGGWVGESVETVPNHSEFPLGKAFDVTIRPFEQVPGAPDPDSNQQVAENRFQSPQNNLIMGESTVCAVADSVRYPDVAKATPKRSRTTAKASCPGDRHVMSGGARASGPFGSQRIVSSAPYDSGDPGAKPDDGWKASVDNLQRKRRRMTVYAICTSSAGLSYVSDGFTATGESRTHVETGCPGGEFVIGGGVRHDVPYRRATLVASRVPLPFPGSAWVVELDNLSQTSANGRGYAICHA